MAKFPADAVPPHPGHPAGRGAGCPPALALALRAPSPASPTRGSRPPALVPSRAAGRRAGRAAGGVNRGGLGVAEASQSPPLAGASRTVRITFLKRVARERRPRGTGKARASKSQLDGVLEGLQFGTHS